MEIINSSLLVITLNANGLNSLIKIYRLAEWINCIQLCAVYKRLSLDLKTCIGWKVERCKDTFHADSNQKKAGVPKLISDKIDFKSKTFRGEWGQQHGRVKCFPYLFLLLNLQAGKHSQGNRSISAQHTCMPENSTLKVDELEHTEEAEPGEQERWCLQS